MLEQLEKLRTEALEGLRAIAGGEELDAWQRSTLGRRGSVTLITRRVGELPNESRPAFGKRANQVKRELTAAYERKATAVKADEMERQIATGAIDVSQPGRPRPLGRLHPSTQVLREICRIWGDMGFQVYRSRDVETDEYNFQLLNMPPHHPARDMWDTFYTTHEGVVLRTHTSPGQIHAMHDYHPEPIRVILPGMCYRYEQISPRSEIQFHQVEGLAVGKNITFSDLKGMLSSFAGRMFGAQIQTRFRCQHFPFTEPSAEMDVECILCSGRGCNVCRKTGWLEILGCGMVHPAVLRHGGYDPTVYAGFAFGMGVERPAMIKYGIKDIRYFWSGDLRFLEQF